MDKAFRQGGEVGADLSRVDWAATPLGTPDTWPQSLKTVVRLMLGSRFSMWMAWGPELTFLCNEAYRRDTLGRKYPWALGRPASEVWAEIWPEIGPRIERVLRHGEATWDEKLQLFLERSGFVEETYHTFSYSPLADDEGTPVGMLCVVTEVTEEVVSQRRIRALTELGAETTGTLTVAETLHSLGETLNRQSQSLPWTLTYLVETAADGAEVARLAATSGFKTDHPVAPAVLPLDAAEPWPVARLMAGEPVLVDDVDLRYEGLPTGAWPEPPKQAWVEPLRAQPPDRPMGFLVVGLNRFRPFDQGYRDLLHLVAGQVVAALTRALAFESAQERTRELERLDRAKTTFFTNVSHELRTPLTLLLGPAEDAVADTSQPLSPAQRDRLDLVLRNGRRLLKLVNTLLDFSRLESGQDAATYDATDLAAYTRELTGWFAEAAQRAGLSLTVGCETLPEEVYVDRDLWAKLVLNLLSNALKFTFAGGITVTLRDQEGRAELRVADTGVGIPTGDRADLFTRFFRVTDTEARSHEGTGVGLALVADVVALHDGTVEVESEPGRGSTFVVRLPYGRGHLPPDRVRAGTHPAEVGEQQTRGYLEEALQWLEETGERPDASPGDDRPRVLVVDDNRDMREYIADLLRRHYVVDTAVDGLDALDRVEAAVPDLVVTDVMMPRLDGFGLLEALHRSPDTTSVPVLMVTARAGEDGAAEGLEAGADDYLTKPFTSRELLARVRANLELDRARRTRSALELSQTRMHEAQRLAHVGSWEVDLVDGRVDVTAELLRILGIDQRRTDELGFPGILEVVHPEDRERVERALEAARGGGLGVVEARIVRPDGEERRIRAVAEALRDAGEVVGLVGSCQDVTEQVRAQRQLTEAQAAREVAAREHAIAEELQRSLLPRSSFDVEHLDVATYYAAGAEGTRVGGDWYDVVDLGAGRVAMVIGDVMGRGVRAAAVMGQLRSAIRAYSRLDLEPASMLQHLDGIVRDLGETQIVTCVYAVFDPSDQLLTVANAGHLPPLMRTPGRGVVRLPSPGGPPLGAGPTRFTDQRLQMVQGSTLVLYTDGLVERRGTDIDRSIDAVGRVVSGWTGSARGLPERLVARVLPQGSDDDVAILVAAMDVPGGREVLTERLPAEVSAPAAARALVVDRLVREGLAPATVQDVVLVVSELVTNAVRHGSPPIELQVRTSGDAVVVEVRDDRTEEPVLRAPRADDEWGRGLRIVDMLSERWGSRLGRWDKSVWSVVRAGSEGADGEPSV